MYYIHTKKATLVDTTYNLTAISQELWESSEGLTLDFYQSYPAPKVIVVPTALRTISSDVLHVLAVWYARGTEITLEDSISLQTKRPRPEWIYTKVDYLPKTYIASGKTTINDAVEFGRKLIEACHKQNQIPFHILEDIYKLLARNFVAHGKNVYCRNDKIMLEIRAELEVAYFIKQYRATAPKTQLDIPIELLHHYAKVFDIEMPTWYLRYSIVETKHGYAMLPYLTQGDAVFYQNIDKTATTDTSYAGNLNDTDGSNNQNKPATLLRDATPKAICQETDLLKLQEQVTFFISLPLDEQKLFMSDRYDYCDNCHEFHELRLGCSCGNHPAIEDDNEYQEILATKSSKLAEVLYNVK